MTGHGFVTGSALDQATWLWAYEHALLSDPSGDLVIEHIIDPDAAVATLRQIGRVRRADLEALPLVLPASACWTAMEPLRGTTAFT